jgi:tripeptidyl-peptidase-1
VLERKYKINIGSKSPTVDDRYFGRESSIYLYNLTHSSVTNKGVTGGIVEYQNNSVFSNSDINLQQDSNNQLEKNITLINGTNQGLDGESELDVQLLSQGADGVNIYYYDTPYWLYSFATDLYNDKHIPDVISMSWGWSEDKQCDIIDCSNNITSFDYVERVNNEYLKLALRGLTITVSSGDAGSPGRTSEGCDPTRPLNAVFPGSSPYVLSVGATYVEKEDKKRLFKTPLCENSSCIEGNKEIIISYDNVGWTSGGGFSQYIDMTPSWQRKEVANYLYLSGTKLPNHTSFNPLGRAYPDVSAIGHSCPTYIGGYLQKIDGTSCSSPVVASLLVLLNDHLVKLNKSKLGFANPLLYHLSRTCKNCFNDITRGHNWCTEFQCCDNPNQYGFNTTRGYDPVSGLGTLNIGNIIAHLNL